MSSECLIANKKAYNNNIHAVLNDRNVGIYTKCINASTNL